MYLAQVNVARMRFLPSDPRMAGLVDQIQAMNQLAEASAGYIWRLPGDQASAESLRVLDWLYQPFEVERLFYNMSVWESLEHLKDYVYRTAHVSMLHGKNEWIDPEFDAPHLALWWIDPGTSPTVEESERRLRSVRDNGPTHYAFTFNTTHPGTG